MDFSWTGEQTELFDAIEKYARESLGQDLQRRDHEGIFDQEGWRGCADLGIHGLCVPEEFGGLNLDPLTTVGALERLGFSCRDNGLVFSINAHMWTVSMPIVEFGSDSQKRRYLPGLCDGSIIGANGTSENAAGSDVFSMRTRATKKGADYVLNGSKTWVTNGPVGDLFVVYASLGENKGVHGISAFLIERGTPGFTISKPLEKMGLRTSPMSELFFDNCLVPGENLLGREGAGNVLFTYSMTSERSSILANAVGSMEYLVARCIEHAKQRRQFGQPIGKFQAVANMIVDMKLKLETSRALLYRSAWLRGQRKRAILEAALTKLHISDSWVSVCQKAIQVFGASGYMVEYGLEREMRDAMAGKLYSGTSEIQGNIVASMLGVS